MVEGFNDAARSEELVLKEGELMCCLALDEVGVVLGKTVIVSECLSKDKRTCRANSVLKDFLLLARLQRPLLLST